MAENPQFIRTDKAIKQALISLLKTKPFEKITVQDILDETPVTRSTFYKHYHDKYEIVEKLQEDFFASQMEIRQVLFENSNSYTNYLQNMSNQNQELMTALLKVKTENVDFRQALAEQAEKFYLSETTGPNRKLEAQIFAQAVTAFQLSATSYEEFSFDFMHEIFTTVFLRVLEIPSDDEIRKQLLKKATVRPMPPLFLS